MKKLLIVTTLIAAGAAVWLGPFAFHHLSPLAWTGEATRLAGVIGAAPGAHIAEIGAGSGAMAREIGKAVGPGGRLYVTEMSPDRRARLETLVREDGLSQIVPVEALAHQTNLPSSCCGALYMRNVLHHIDDWPRYARDIVRTVRPGGVVAVIDFAPGALPHLTDDHGASPEQVVEAFASAGLLLERRDDAWGGGTYLLVFRRVE